VYNRRKRVVATWWAGISLALARDDVEVGDETENKAYEKLRKIERVVKGIIDRPGNILHRTC